jgi:glycerol-3-phosphate dehydrogenase
VLERSRLPVLDAVVMSEDKRILFAIPWGDRTIVGTTDTDFPGPPKDVRADAADIAQLLTIVSRFFPAANLKESDVISVWAGLRPLLADPNGQPSDISRSHHIGNPEPGWWDVAGGKLTTYRLMAEQTVDRIVKWLIGLNQFNATYAECRTAKEPLLPGSEVQGLSGILPPKLSRATVEHYVKNEWAVRLEDVMLRRTGWHFYFADARSMAEQVAEWMSELLDWSGPVRTRELEDYHEATGLTANPTKP